MCLMIWIDVGQDQKLKGSPVSISPVRYDAMFLEGSLEMTRSEEIGKGVE